MQLAALSHDIFIPFLIPIAAMAVGIPAIGEQVEDGTIVFTWTRPIKRRAIYLGRLLAAQVVATTADVRLAGPVFHDHGQRGSAASSPASS